MPITKTIAISITGFGLSSLGIIGTYKLLEPKTVKEQLQWDGYSLLSFSEGDTAWENIKNSNKESQKKQELQKFIKEHESDTSESGDDIDIQKLKKACEKILEKEPIPENVKVAQKYCATKD